MRKWVATPMASDHYTHVAVANDTWDTIAYAAYGEERMASSLIQANPRLGDVVVFEGGEEVRVPYVTSVATPSSLPPWRR